MSFSLHSSTGSCLCLKAKTFGYADASHTTYSINSIASCHELITVWQFLPTLVIYRREVRVKTSVVSVEKDAMTCGLP